MKSEDGHSQYMHDLEDVLKTQYGPRDFQKHRLDIGEDVAPVRSGMGPSKHDGALGCPFGGHHRSGSQVVNTLSKSRHSNERAGLRQDMQRIF